MMLRLILTYIFLSHSARPYGGRAVAVCSAERNLVWYIFDYMS